VSKFEIEILNYFDSEEFVAEIYYGHIQWCIITPKKGKLIVQFYAHPHKEDWEFPYEEAMEVLEKAKRKLFKKINAQSSLFPSLPTIPDGINQLGQELLANILNHPKVHSYPNRYGGKDIFEPSGKGARYDKEGHFLGFLQAG
jgi:hypothetical protein